MKEKMKLLRKYLLGSNDKAALHGAPLGYPFVKEKIKTKTKKKKRKKFCIFFEKEFIEK